MSDLKLHVRLTADGTQVQSAVRSTSAELDHLQATTRAVDAAQKTAAQSARAFEQSVARVGAVQVPAARAAEQLTGQFKLQKGALQQVGYQVQDFTVQVASGQSALVALAQQGSQLAGVLGPGGALLGAVIAIGSVVASVLVNSMEDGADATDTLRIALGRLDDAVEESDGIPTLAKQIRELAQESEVAARARIVSAMSAAEIASKSSARAIRDAFDDIADTVGFSSLSDFFFDAQTEGGMRAIRGAMDDLRESLQLTGAEGEAAAAQIFGALRRLNADPTIENFKALEQTVATVSTGIGASSEPLQTLVATLGQYFDAARNAADKTEFLKSALGNLATVSEPASQEVQKMVEALQAQAAAIGESRRETSLRIAQDKKADAAQLAAINSAYDLIEAEEKKAKAAKDAEAARRRSEQESLKAAAAERAYAKELENLRSAADPAYAATARLASAKETLDKALAKGDVDRGTYDHVLTSLEGLYSGTTAATAAHEKWLATVQDSIDPMRRFEREAAKLRESFDKGELGDISSEQLAAYIKKMESAARDSSEKSAKQFENRFATAAQSVAQSLQNAIASGDWSNLGEAVGGTFAASLSALLNQQITDALSKGLNEDSGTLDQAVAAFAGPIVGAVAGGVMQLAISEVSKFFRDDWDPTADRQRSQGTGTVLGDAAAKTDSILKAVEVTASATSELVGINRDMLRALQAVQAGIIGASARIARGSADAEFSLPGVRANAFDITGLLSVDSNVQQLASNAASSFLNLMTLGFGDTVGKLLGGKSKQVDDGIRITGGVISDLVENTVVEAFATFRVKKNALSGYKTRESFERLGDDVGRQFSLVFADIYRSVEQGAEALGVLPADVRAALDNFAVETTRLSFEGLNAEQKQAELQYFFGTVFDGLAASAIPFLDEFARSGEGLGETLARVANAVMVTEDVVDRLGVRFQQLAGADLADASLRLVELAGGIEELARNSAGFLQNFATPERQMEVITRDLERALGQVNLQLPASRDGFYDLVQAQDASTQSGAEAIATLLRVQAVAADYYDRIERMISDELEARLQANAIVLRAAQDGLAALRAEVTGVSSAAASLSQQMTPAAVQRDAARQVLSRALTTGDFSGAAAAAASVAQIRASDYASELEFRREQANTLSLLRLVEREGAIQIDYAAAAVDAITAQTDAIRDEAQRGRDHLEALLAERSDQTQPAGVPGFASGGVHAGGWRVVGERGPELEFTGPSRIYSNAQSRALFDTTELLAELRAIRDRVSRIEGHSMHISTSTRQTSRVIERWEIGGLPPERAL